MLLGTEDFVYANRLAFAAFFHGNGFKDIDEIERVFKYYNRNWNNMRPWDIRFRHFGTIFTYLDRAHKAIDDSDYYVQSTYYYFNMTTRLTMFYDGFVRGPKGEKIKYNP